MKENQEIKEVDVLIIGSGPAGLTCATVAAQKGLRVLLVEKAPVFGGTAAQSGGAIWIPNNPVQPQVGIEDNHTSAETYLKNVLKDKYDSELINAFLQSGPEMVSYMEKNTPVKFSTFRFPDYFPDEEGASWGRSLFSISFDGTVLGSFVKKVRLPIIGYSTAFGTMQVSAMEAGVFTSVFKNAKSFFTVTGRFFQYLWHLIRFGKGAHLANGNALIGRLVKSNVDAKVEMWHNAPGLSLIQNKDRVEGAMVEYKGVPVKVIAKRGVVVASGGFGANPHLREKYYLKPEGHLNANPEENVGDGILAALAVGAAMGEKKEDQAVWAPTSVLKFKDGTYRRYPHFGPDRAKPGQIIVDISGKRFANEAAPYVPFVHTMKEKDINTAFLIADSRARAKYGLGFALAKPYPDLGFSKSGYLISAPTIKELAHKLNISAEALEETVKTYNEHAKQGHDPEFHKGENSYDASQGDPQHKPNANVGPLEKAPFYAVKIHPGDVNSCVGIKINKNAQAVNEQGEAIEGLYAIGVDSNSIFQGVYPGGGSGIGPAMTFGYRAALHLADNK